MSVFDRKSQRMRRHTRIRKKVSGTAERPRFCVSITTNHIYCQFIDDVTGRTLANTSSLSAQFKAENARPNMDGAALLGKLAAEAAIAANVTEVVFDRSGYKYHGRIKAIAEAARANGLKF
ncbi:MAG: 50S ribosomal protein L18 [Lentisphaeria bacterium]|nr:50S ribosomal protein L18 [Lentisphaeria bacterium]